MTEAHEPGDAHRMPILLAGGVTVLATIVGVAAVIGLLHGGRQSVRLRPDPRYDQTVPVEVNEVEAAAFALPTDAERADLAARTRLDSFGWVDRAQNIVHIPIDRAIDQYVQSHEEEP